MLLRLDNRYPLVWRSPDSLQLGVDDPPVTLEGVTLAQERMLAALTVGTTRPGLSLIGTQSGLTEREVSRFHRQVSPALESPKAPDRPIVVVAGMGPTVDRLAYRLTEAGLSPRLVGPDPHRAVATPLLCNAPFAIVVAHYVLDPEFYGLWLRRDVPHLPIVFGDTSVRIGPVIQPGDGPCLYCLDRQRTDADPAWPAIASQLWGVRSTAEVPLLASEAATLAARLALEQLRGLPFAAGTSFTIDAETGETSTRHWLPHPECFCSGIAGAPAPGAGRASATPISVLPAPAPRGSGTARSPRPARQTGTRTGAASSVPA
jgi:bacteriocin biosynthesis cyclodehydratase domain-containing protein